MVVAAPPPHPHRLVHDGTASNEAIKGFVSGVAFGVASPLAAHPIDTIRVRMQALPALARGGSIAALRQTIATGGVRALWNGLLPPLLGSAVFRSLQMSSFAATVAALRDSPWATRTDVPGFAGLQPRVLVASGVATTLRSVIETPLEVLKVRRQCGTPYALAGTTPLAVARDLSTGFCLTWARLYIAMSTFFVLIDHTERHYPGLWDRPGGSFMKGSFCATSGWVLAWPLELAKNLAQSGLHARSSAFARLQAIVRERGLAGMYRGLGPGLLRSVIGNGAAVTAFDLTNDYMDRLLG